MYYVSSKKDNLYGITNTYNGVEEFYTYDYICNNFDSSKIYGVNANNIDVWNPKKEIIKVKLSGERYLNCKDLILDLVDSKVVAIKYVSDSRNLIIPNFINELGVRCFKNRKTLENVIIPDSVISLGNDCFSGCDNLVSIKIPSSVVSLGKGCFSLCKNLESIILPDSVTILDDFCFHDCSSLRKVKLPSSVKKFGICCFGSCDSFKNIVIPNSVEVISSNCFKKCINLESVIISDSVNFIGEDCFLECDNLKVIEGNAIHISMLSRYDEAKGINNDSLYSVRALG